MEKEGRARRLTIRAVPRQKPFPESLDLRTAMAEALLGGEDLGVWACGSVSRTCFPEPPRFSYIKSETGHSKSLVSKKILPPERVSFLLCSLSAKTCKRYLGAEVYLGSLRRMELSGREGDEQTKQTMNPGFGRI